MKKIALEFASILLASAAGQPLFAVQNCVAQDFNGTYGIVAHGAVTVPGFPITGPFARAGQVIANGRGAVVFKATASYNGLFFGEDIKASYTMLPDCSMVFTVEPFAPIYQAATFNAFLSNNKRQVDFIISVPFGQVISAVLKKQDAACTVRSLSGPYVLHMTGSVIANPQPYPFIRLGRFTPDGNGNFFAQTTANYGGHPILPEDFSGTYIVTKDCTLSLQYTYQNTAYSWTGSVVENGKGANLIVHTPGTVVAGTIVQQ